MSVSDWGAKRFGFHMIAQLPPIYPDYRRLLIPTEEMVRRFSRYQKYTLGAALLQAAMRVMRPSCPL